MVHALREAHRVLRPGGVVADLRPERDPGNRRRRYIRAEIHWDGRWAAAGTMPGPTEDTPYYIGADRAVARVLRDDLFWLESTRLFWLRTYFRDLEAVDRFLDREWTGTRLPDNIRRGLLRALRRHPGGRLASADLVRLNVLRKER